MKMTPQEIVKELNEICLMEFKANYNKSEAERILSTGDYAIKAKELEDKLQAQANEGIKVRVSGEGLLMIMKYEGIKFGAEMYSNVRNILAPVSYKLPYTYGMGRPVSKKIMIETIERLTRELKIIDKLNDEEKENK